jgi:undecaprenyl-diphosphatase
MDPLYREEETEATPARVSLAGTALIVGLICAGVALAVFVWLGYQIRAGEPTEFDLAAREAVRSLQGPVLTSIMWGASVYGAPRLLGPLGLVAAVVFWRRGWRRGAILTVAMLAGALLLDSGLKQAFGRVRPDAFFEFYPAPVSYSFPSGHALFATSFFGGIAVLASHRIRSPEGRALLWVAAGLLILLIGVSRIYLGVHYPTDVIGGYAVGLVWVTALALGDRLAERRLRV